MVLFFFLKENSEDFYNDILTYRVTNLENALHSVCLHKYNKKKEMNMILGSR
jgi:hypothetical protein